MTQNDAPFNKHRRTHASNTLIEISAFAKKRAEEFKQFHSHIIEEMEEVNRHWLDRLLSEAALATELTSKLAAARSIPETTAACQEWASRQMSWAAEDANYIIVEGQRAMQRGAHLLSNAWLSIEQA